MYGDFIKKVLDNSSKIAIKRFGNVLGSVKGKDNNQVLTETDLEIGSFIVKNVGESFPDHNIIDEEAGVINKKSSFTWVIDPIDGTSNFVNGLPHYGIMLGLLNKDCPIAGGIALPFFNEIYTAVKDEGAFCNTKKISVTGEEKLLNSLVVYQIDGHQENPELTINECKLLAKIVLKIRNLRTTNSAFDAAMVAKGKYGAILNKTSKIWDNVAQQIIIEEAGGVYTDFYGNKIDYSDHLKKADNNFTYCAASKILHSQLIDIIKKNE